VAIAQRQQKVLVLIAFTDQNFASLVLGIV
jgi:hypothetical protein